MARRAAVFGAAQPALPLAGAAQPKLLSGGAARRELPSNAARPERALGGAVGRLRPWQAKDLPGVTAACQDPESARWTTVPVPYSEDHARQFMYEHTPAQWARGSDAVFAIADEQDEYVGSIDLRIDPSDEQSAEVGYMVAPWARGHGYATAAVRRLCSWGFEALGLSRIVWKAYLGNDASRRVAEKAGFTIEGIQRAGCAQRGERIDAWVGSLLP
jgi:RimJ/RimL family protein N-acetyltransferase